MFYLVTVEERDPSVRDAVGGDRYYPFHHKHRKVKRKLIWWASSWKWHRGWQRYVHYKSIDARHIETATSLVLGELTWRDTYARWVL